MIMMMLYSSQVYCYNINMNKVIKRFIAITTASSMIMTTNTLPSYGSNEAFVSSLASIIEAKDVIKPVKVSLLLLSSLQTLSL